MPPLLFFAVKVPLDETLITRLACEYIFAAASALESPVTGASMSWWALTSGVDGSLKRLGIGGVISPTPIEPVFSWPP